MDFPGFLGPGAAFSLGAFGAVTGFSLGVSGAFGAVTGFSLGASGAFTAVTGFSLDVSGAFTTGAVALGASWGTLGAASGAGVGVPGALAAAAVSVFGVVLFFTGFSAVLAGACLGPFFIFGMGSYLLKENITKSTK